MSHFRSRKLFTRAAANVCACLMVLLLTGICMPQDAAPAKADDPVELFNNGQDEHAKGNFSGAIELYDRALKLLPEFAEAEFQKGNAYSSLGKRDEAEKAFRRAIELRPEWTLPLAALGTLLERRDEFVESEKLLIKAIAINDSSFPAYVGLVELRLKTGASLEVLKPLLEKLRAFTSKANVPAAVFATQASLENALGDFASAKKSVAKALEIEPNLKSALYAKADTAIGQGDLVLAEEVVKSIEKLDAGTESAALLRARVLILAGKNDEAKKVLSGISSPSQEVARLAQKLALADEVSPEVLEKAFEKYPKDVFVVGKLCSIYRVTAPDKAMDFCKRALELEPTNINHAIGYGAALVQAKRYDDAVTVLRRLLQAAPDNSTIHANLGTALFQSKRFAEAKTEFQWLTSHEPTPPIAYYFLAICHDQLEEYLDAGANYNLFLKHADVSLNQLEIDKVKLRLPLLDRQIKLQAGKSKPKNGGER
jgi:tetratricopeptide (TPR) repeat protein